MVEPLIHGLVEPLIHGLVNLSLITHGVPCAQRPSVTSQLLTAGGAIGRLMVPGRPVAAGLGHLVLCVQPRGGEHGLLALLPAVLAVPQGQRLGEAEHQQGGEEE